MTRRDDIVFLRHMLDYATDAVTIAVGRDESELDHDRLLFLGLLKAVETVGEAANRVSPATRELYPQIPWAQIIGTRNRLVHGYDKIDHKVLWDVISLDLPILIPQLRTILGDVGDSP